MGFCHADGVARKNNNKEKKNEIKKSQAQIDEEKARKWLNEGAQITDTVKNLFSKAGISKKEN